MTYLTQDELKNLTKDFKLGKYAKWINGIEEKEKNNNKTIRKEWTSWIQENVLPFNYTHFFTLTLRDNRISSNSSIGSSNHGNHYYITPGLQRYRKAITRFENLMRRAPITHYAIVTEEGEQKGNRMINLHAHGLLRYTGDWEITPPSFDRPFNEWGNDQGMYRLEVIKNIRSANKYLTKYLTKENTLWHFGLFNSKKESDMRTIFKDKLNSIKRGEDLIKSNLSAVQISLDGHSGEIDPNQFMKYVSNKRN